MTLKGRTAGGALLLAVLLGTCAQCQQPTTETAIVTDRPDVTESSIVIPKGSVQFENGIAWTKDHGDQVVDLSETLVRVGLLNRTEIRLVVPNYVADLTRPPAGFSDIAIGMKQQLGPLPGHFDLSVIVAMSLPTGAARVSSHGFDPFVKFPWSKDLGNGWSIGGMQSLFWNTQDGRQNLTWEPTFTFDKEITDRWSVFVEYAGDFLRLSGSQQIAHFGTAYRITRKQQIDSHFGFGLSPSSLGRFFAIGYSIRLDKRAT
jgi:outer membrane putative beta-barrel porin/alpha-amylase